MPTKQNNHIRGSHPSNPISLSRDGSCISELGMQSSFRELEPTQSKKIAYVKTLNSVSKRVVIPVWVKYGKTSLKTYGDIITGTLYREDGKCLSSSQLEIIKWGKVLGKTPTKGTTNDPTYEQVKKIQRNWASGRPD